ncbi:hypothetical protein H0H87_006374 [Tephrocybe sp. NHM501043]|nr:hypothetical protein H0H87_006374 [Tephrocybe sp. NHM501043]
MQPPTRRLTTRRGSTAASDPHGAHAALNHLVQSSSTLTIVRVISPPPQPEAAPAPTSSPRRIHRRLPSQPSSAVPSAASPDRLSFAFSSFAPGSASGGPAVPNPPTSPRPRPSPPHRQSSPHRLSANLPSIPRLSPDQLLDLARASTNQRIGSPVGYSESPSHSPQVRPSSPSGPHPHSTTAHATFTPLPDDIYLPFIDRPSEVAALISTPPSAKLFSLLEKTLATITVSSADPSKWTYHQLLDHLTQVTRQQSSDFLWVLQARKCIISHSELIWERVKGALGVPPELDIDYDPNVPLDELFDASSVHSASSIDTDELSDDHGRAARGHWEDWDAIMDSPVYDRRPYHPASPVIPLSLNDPIHLEVKGTDSSEATISPTPHGLFSPEIGPVSPSSLLSIEPLLANTQTHTASISPSSYSSIPTGEISGLGLDDIQEGAEEEEEPATPSEGTTTEVEPSHEPSQEGEEETDPSLIAPSQIQGLRISTTPITVSDLTSPHPVAQTHQLPTSPNVLTGTLSISSSVSSLTGGAAYKPPSPISPLPPYNYPAGTSVPRSRPTSGTFIRPQIGGYGPGGAPSVFRRSDSFGSIGSLRGIDHIHRDRERPEREEGDGYSSSASDGGHAPGSPLFPSNFARLNPEPTLVHGHGQG